MRTLQRQNRPQALAEIAGCGSLWSWGVGRLWDAECVRVQCHVSSRTDAGETPNASPEVSTVNAKTGGEGRVGDKMFLLQLILAEAEPGSDSPPAAHSAATLSDS